MFIRKEIASSLVILLFGVGFMLYNLKYPLDQWANPGPGVFPLVVGAVLVILAGWQLTQEVRKQHKLQEPKDGEEESGKSITALLRAKTGEAKPLIMIVVFIAYLLLVKWVGFFVSNFLFVIISSRLMGAKGWRGPIALSAGINLFCYFLFVAWIKLSFPGGVLF